jgi:uncharacterized protein
MGTHIGQMAQEVARMNPWWRTGASWAKHDPDLVDVARLGIGYHSKCLDDLSSGALYMLRGPRRVGKTVAMKQTIQSLLEAGVPPLAIVRVDVDGWDANAVRTVVSNTALPPVPPGQNRWWFFDEISAVPDDWAEQIRWLRGNDPEFRDATVVLTGSSATSLTAAAGVLAGRRGQVENVDRTLLPMGMRTFAETLNPALADLPRLSPGDLFTPNAKAAFADTQVWLDDLVKLWELYLLYGGFPVAVGAAKQGQPIPTWFVNDMFNVIYRDAFANGSLSESQTISLVDRLWVSLSTPVNVQSISDDTMISYDIVGRHIGYLQSAYLAWSCPQKADDHWVAKPKAPDKIYAIDPLIARMGHLRTSKRNDIDVTELVEMQIGLALRRAVASSGRAWTEEEPVLYVRTPSRGEIDFVSEALNGVALEGKYTQGGGWRRDARGVRASSFNGILTTRNVLDCADADAWAVPAATLAALLDT